MFWFYKRGPRGVNEPEDAVVSEMIKQQPQEQICEITKCFQERFMELGEAPSSWRIVKLVFLRKPDAAPKKGKKLQGHCADVGDVEMVCDLCNSTS